MCNAVPCRSHGVRHGEFSCKRRAWSLGLFLRAVVVGLATAFLVVWWRPSLLRATPRARRREQMPPAPARSAARRDKPRPGRDLEFCRRGGPRRAGGREHLHGPRRHREKPRSPPLDQLFGDYLAESTASTSSEPGLGRHRFRFRHDRDQSTRDRQSRLDQGAARRRAHRRCQDRGTGPGHRPRRAEPRDREIADHAARPLRQSAGRRHRARDRQSLRA